MTAHPHAIRAWGKLDPSDVPLYRLTIDKLVNHAENVRVTAMTGSGDPMMRTRFHMPGSTMYTARAGRSHRVVFTYVGRTIHLLDFTLRSNRAYYRREL